MRTVPDAALLPLMPPLMRADFDPAFRSTLTREDVGLLMRRERAEPTISDIRVALRGCGCASCRDRGVANP